MTELGNELLTRITNDFNKRLKQDRKLKTLGNRVRDGTSYEDAGEYAVRVGELLSKSMNQEMKGLSYISNEVANEILTPLLEYDHELVSEAVKSVQTNMNNESGLGIEALTADLDTNRIQGLTNKISSYETFEQGQWLLNEPIINYSQAVVDQSIEKNARAAAKMGLKRYIIRKAEPAGMVKRKRGKGYYNVPCKWCANLEGTYEYKGNGSNIPHDVYRRHESCRCTLTFVNGKERQNVWNHSETWTSKDTETQKDKLTKAQLRKQEKERQEAQRREIERVLRSDIGFADIDPKVIKLVDPELLEPNVERLKSLEERFNIVHRSNNPWFSYDGRSGAIAYVQRYTNDPAHQNLYVCGKWYRDASKLIEEEIKAVSKNWSMPIDTENIFELKTYSITHEYGHMIHNYLYKQYVLSTTGTAHLKTLDSFVYDIRSELVDIAKQNNPNFNILDNISRYGQKNNREFFAEVFANSQGSRPNELGKAMQTWLERQGF